MTAPEPDAIVWRTSSYSAESGGCVEGRIHAGVRPGARLQGPRRPRAGCPHPGLANVPHHPYPLTTALQRRTEIENIRDANADRSASSFWPAPLPLESCWTRRRRR